MAKLFKFDEAHQQQNLLAIKELKSTLDELVLRKDSKGEIGDQEADNLIKGKFKSLFNDIDPFDLLRIERIAKLTWNEYQRRLLIHFVNKLMGIPYKYGRENLKNDPLAKISTYIANRGLINLAKDLAKKPGLAEDKAIFSPLIEEVVKLIGLIK